MGYDRSDSFLSIFNQMELYLVQNREENYYHDHHSNIVFSVYLVPTAGKNSKVTGVSRYHGGIIKDPPETSQRSQHNCFDGFKGGPQWLPHYSEIH